MIYVYSKVSHRGAVNCSFSRIREYLSRSNVYSLDTETTGLDPLKDKVTLIQVGDPVDQYLIDVKYLNYRKIQALKKLFENSSKKLLVNAFFDYRMLLSNFNIRLNEVIDLSLAEQLIHLGDWNISEAYKNSSFVSLARKYLGINLETNQLSLFSAITKSTRLSFKSFDSLSEEQVRYAAYDVQLPQLIYEKQLKILKEKDLLDCNKLENRFVRVLGNMSISGFRLDTDKWIYLYNETLLKRMEYERKLIEIADINWSSHVQVKNVFRELGVNMKIEKGGEIKESIEQSVLEDQKHIPEVDIYLRYKSYEKAESTYGMNFIKKYVYKDCRIHPEFNQLVRTGRISSKSPNSMNIKRGSEYRGCFIANPGNVLVCMDYSQQELRQVGDLSQEPKIIKTYLEGGDLHSATAINMFGELTPENRYVGKTVNFITIYGGGAHKISDKFGYPLDKSKKLLDSYFKGYPRLTEYFKEKTEESIKNGYILIDKVVRRKVSVPHYEELKYCIRYLRKCTGRNYPYYPILDRYRQLTAQIQRKCQNYPVQGSCASMMKLAAIKFQDWIDRNHAWNRVEIVNIVHDEIIVECRNLLANKVKQVLTSCMIEAGKEFCPTVPMKADGKISSVWEH